MVSNSLPRWIVAAVLGASLFITPGLTRGDESPARNNQSWSGKSTAPVDHNWQYSVDATMFSMIPEKGLASFQRYGSGSVGPNGTLGLGVAAEDRRFDVSVKGVKKEGRFSATISVDPKQEDRKTAAVEQVFDLSDLKPQILEVAKDEDGRIFRLNLIPRAVEAPLPKTFREEDLRLSHWNFQDSQVVLNDQDYLGQLNMAGGPIGFVDIPGLAMIEFSLLPLRDAKPEGELRGGTIAIKHEDQTRLRITNVRNGANTEPLPHGPYQVWVRWLKPSLSVEQYRESVRAHLAKIKEEAASGDRDVPREAIERLERTLQSDRIFQISNGLRGVRKDDLETPQE